MRGAAVSTVAIIGTGLLGRGIASVVARAGHSLVLHDSNAEMLASACEYLRETAVQPDRSLRAEPKLEDAVVEADIVIEAVIENLGLKQQVFERMGAINARALLMSNSSVLPIGQIALHTAVPERTVGTHWWNPPHLIPVIEVIRGPRTSDEVMRRTAEFLAALGKTPVRVERDVPGFVGNRLQHALWREALALVSDGTCDAEDVDRIVAVTLGQSLAQRGPFAEMKRLGIAQVAHEFTSVLSTVNSDSSPARLLRRKVELGQLGAKSGQGFLSWSSGAREQAARRLQQHIEVRLARPADPTLARRDAPLQLSDRDEPIARHLRVSVWREAIALIENGICDAETVDLMAVNTIGLRLAVMGPIENADFVGLDLTLAIHEAVLPSLNASTRLPMWLQAAQGKPALVGEES